MFVCEEISKEKKYPKRAVLDGASIVECVSWGFFIFQKKKGAHSAPPEMRNAIDWCRSAQISVDGVCVRFCMRMRMCVLQTTDHTRKIWSKCQFTIISASTSISSPTDATKQKKNYCDMIDCLLACLLVIDGVGFRFFSFLLPSLPPSILRTMRDDVVTNCIWRLLCQ